RGLVPRPGAVARVFVATALVAVCAAVGSALTGGNYMFVRDKPSESLLDVLGPWPWYIATTALLGLAMFAALDAPFRRRRAGSA
ncbi:MAG: YwaF family protein, partial [Actinomycetota bacterium]|nr:YwaF family protein [Actinomycetota bacterium]